MALLERPQTQRGWTWLERNCDQCEATFYVMRCDAKKRARRFCGRKCYEANRSGRVRTAADIANAKTKYVYGPIAGLICVICGKEHTARWARRPDAVRCCGPECTIKYAQKIKMERWNAPRATDEQKRVAALTVKAAIRRGDIVRPEKCQQCGGSGEIQGHHEDYSKPLDVQWLCRSCHQRRHHQEKTPANASAIERLAGFEVGGGK